MRLVHVVFAIATALPIVAWAAALLGAVLIHNQIICTAPEGTICSAMGMDAATFSAFAFFYASWGLLILAPFTLGAALLWAIVTLIAVLVRRRRQKG